MKSLDPRAQAVVDHLLAHSDEFAGSIMPRWLPGALPARSAKRGWRDAVAMWLLSELLGAHRVAKGQPVFFRGPLYQVDRVDMAERFGTCADEISESINWLQQIGVIDLVHRTRIDSGSKPTGTLTFAVPVMSKLAQFRKRFLETGKTPAPVKYEPRRSKANHQSTETQTSTSATPVIGGLTPPTSGFDSADEGACIVTAPKRRMKLVAGDDDETSPQWQDACPDDRRGLVVVAGDGEAVASNKQKLISPDSKFMKTTTTQSPSNNHNPNHPADPAPPLWQPVRPPVGLVVTTPEQQSAWLQTWRLVVLYEQVIMRTAIARNREICRGDAEKAFRYFEEHVQQTAFYTSGVLIQALFLASENSEKDGGYDKFWHCRQVMHFPTFIRHMAAGEIESEIGCAGRKINTWRDLRFLFTQSELLFYGWKPAKIPSVRIDQEDLWEASTYAPDFYRSGGLRLPDEVQAVLENQSASADEDIAEVVPDQDDPDAPAS